MATPLNAFKTKVWSLRDSDAAQGKLIYNTPPGVTAIVLQAQVSNVDTAERTCRYSFVHKDVGTGEETPLVQKFPVRKEDAASPLTGKLIVQEGNQILAYIHAINTRTEVGGVGFTDADDSLKLTLSLLESLNA